MRAAAPTLHPLQHMLQNVNATLDELSAGAAVFLGSDSGEEEDFDHGDVNEGREDETAGKPYTNRGRTVDVWRTLNAYGFEQGSERKPNPCFELFVRNAVRRGGAITDTGELADWPVKRIADRIRGHECWTYYGERERQCLAAAPDDHKLVNECCSEGGTSIAGGEDYYFSFCRMNMARRRVCVYVHH